jgi:hypothetical protein
MNAGVAYSPAHACGVLVLHARPSPTHIAGTSHTPHPTPHTLLTSAPPLRNHNNRNNNNDDDDDDTNNNDNNNQYGCRLPRCWPLH